MEGDIRDASTASTITVDVFTRYVARRIVREQKIFDGMKSACTRPSRPAGISALDLVLVPLVYDDVSPAAWTLAKLSIDAHLEKLEREGRIAWTDRANVFPAW